MSLQIEMGLYTYLRFFLNRATVLVTTRTYNGGGLRFSISVMQITQNTQLLNINV